MFNGAGAMRIERGASLSPLRTMTGQAQLSRMRKSRSAKGEGCPGTGEENIPSLHAGGAANGRGVKRPPCPRPPDNDARGRRVLRFFELPVAASTGGCPIHAGPSCVPGPPYGAPPDPHGPRGKGGRHPRQRELA